MVRPLLRPEIGANVEVVPARAEAVIELSSGKHFSERTKRASTYM